MTVFMCDGFESYGDTLSSGADIESRIDATNRHAFIELSGGHTGASSLIDDFEAVGYAFQFPLLTAGRAEWVTYEYPDGTGRNPDYKLTTNASTPVMCAGFRFYNADTTPNLEVDIFSILSSSTGVLSGLRRDGDNTSLTFEAGSTPFQGLNALSLDTWHYIEVEWKLTSSSNGGYAKVYVNGSLVIDTGPASLAATFFTSYGIRVGCNTSTTQTAGNQFAFDDVYAMEIDGVEHTAPLGPCRVLAMRPNADATPNDWTPSSGSDNFEMVNEDDWNLTDYVDSAVTGDTDHYTLTPIPSVDTVHGARIDVACIATSGTPNLHIGFDNGVTDDDDMGTVGTGSESNIQEFHEKDPSNVNWTEGSIESAEVTQRSVE